MFGKLTIDAIPYQEPIIIATLIIILSSIIFLFLTVTFLGKWKYLWKEWITSVDHKKIGVMYITVAFLMMFRGFIDAVMMRSHQFLVSGGKGSFLSVQHYDQIMTAHGVIMIIFVATPLIIGLMNLVVPLQIGARDMAFPTLNSISFWLFVSGVFLINLSLGLGDFAQTGWSAYPPLSLKEYSPDVGVDYWIWSIQISGIGTTLTGINFIVTILKMRIPGMTMMKIPAFTWNALCSNILITVSFPILTVAVTLLALDRLAGTHFFTNDLGGNSMMYINLFWAWGHPEVYILVLPVFGIFSEVVSTFSKKSLFGYSSLIWSTIAITLLSFCVWLHHFFTMGSGASVNSFFGIMTMIIAIPTGVKIFNWIFTIYKGRFSLNSITLWVIGFIITFSIGGMSGVLLAIPGINFLLHNSLFLVAHFHNVIIGGVIFGCFSGITYWFPKFFGFTLNEFWGKCAFYLWTIGFCFAFFPLYLLGMMGMTRRLSQNIDFDFHFLLAIAFFGTCLIFFGIISQIIQIFISVLDRNKNLDLTGDPWNGRTLEWFTSSPPPIYNFSFLPKGKIERDMFWKMKQDGFIRKKRIYEGISIQKNTGFGFFIFVFSTIFGFSMIWEIWWLAIIGIVTTVLVWIYYSFNRSKHYILSSKEIEKIEDSYFNLVKKWKKN